MAGLSDTSGLSKGTGLIWLEGGLGAAGLSGGAAFSPLSLAPLLFLLPRPANLYQTDDTSTPVMASGQAVGHGVNLGTASVQWAQATAGLRGTYQESGGVHWLEFDQDGLDLSAHQSLQTICMAVRTTTLQAEWAPTWISPGADGAGQVRRQSSTGTWGRIADDGNNFPTTLFVNGVEDNTLTEDVDQVIRAVAGSAISTGSIGGVANRFPIGRLYALVGFAGTLTAEQAGLVDAYLSALCENPPL